LEIAHPTRRGRALSSEVDEVWCIAETRVRL
jgi:hypothetical protein